MLILLEFIWRWERGNILKFKEKKVSLTVLSLSVAPFYCINRMLSNALAYIDIKINI